MTNNNKNDSSGEIIGLIILLLILGALFSDPSPSQPTTSPDAQTWQQFAQSPSSEDVLVQLANSQNLIVALGNDVSRLQAQNVDIQQALDTVNNQLFLAQEQSREESKRQSRETWITTIIGTLVGWVLGRFPPTRSNLQKAWNFIKSPFASKHKNQEQREVSNESEIDLNEQKANDLVSIPQTVISNLGDVGIINLASTKLCPKCGNPMEVQKATRGESKEKWFYVCHYDQEFEQFFPVE